MKKGPQVGQQSGLNCSRCSFDFRLMTNRLLGRDHDLIQAVTEALVRHPVQREPSVLAGHLLEAVPCALEQSASEVEVVGIRALDLDAITHYAAEELVK